MNNIGMKISAILFAAIALSSCSMVEIASEKKYQQIMSSHVGKDVSVLINDFSYPDEIMEAPNGNKLYVYASSSSSTSPVNCKKDLSGNTSCTGGNTSTSWCKTYFEVGSDNIVKEYSYKGNNCRWCRSDVMLCM